MSQMSYLGLSLDFIQSRKLCIFFFFLISFYFWVYRLGIAVLPTAPTTI